MFQGCDKYFNSVKSNRNITGSCAVLFEENCCKAVGTFGSNEKLLVVPRGGKGKLCGASRALLNSAASLVGAGTASSCNGPNLKDKVKVIFVLFNVNSQSFIVMPGCTLEVWDKESDVEKKGALKYAEEEEKKGANAGNLQDAIDRCLLSSLPSNLMFLCVRYDRNKLSITATGSPNWIEELDDDFDDMDEDIETYRCTCK